MSVTVALPSPVRLTVRQRLRARWAAWRAHRVICARDPDDRLRVVMARLVRDPGRPSSAAEAEHAVHAVTTARLRLGGTKACLERALAALLYARSYGHISVLVIGIRPGTADIHAWLEAEGRPVAEPFDPRPAYLPITVYTPGANP
ncbi:lasso peptide biosynthesis B2 protein [Kitasatospora sp. NPDC093558]|uniref:lasso peptide biosynthesis B2 protein n=1 Tax=Kitasatospora sp. NPDC093558 TaxID=3155201 RepID=UPI0034375D16